MKINSEMILLAEKFVTAHLQEKLDKKFTYHNQAHTLKVVNAVDEICTGLGVNGHEKKIVKLAAWFHDAGYTTQTAGHESEGAGLAEKFLYELQVDAGDIEKVKACIMATHYPQQPASLAEMILCDADMAHLAEKDYLPGVEALRIEWHETKGQTFTDRQWIVSNISFLKQHHFHTSYAAEKFEKRKKKNIQKLEAMLGNTEGIRINGNGSVITKKKKDEEVKMQKGAENIFRTASTNHMRLSSMADNKAHILLSVNSIIISVILSVLIKKIPESNYVIIPVAVLLTICVVTTIFAVLTTRPKISKGIFTAEQIRQKGVNLLFFGNFHQMDFETYERGVKEMIQDKEYLHSSMTMDIYFLGKVLAAKYRYLNIGYRIFMYGLTASVLSFALCFFLAHTS